MRRSLCILLLLALLVIGTAAHATLNPAEEPGGADISRLYAPPSGFSMVETITQTGVSEWQYTYSFTNTDTNAIWHWGVYQDFSASSVAAGPTTPDSGWSTGNLSAYSSAYDPSNVEPGTSSLQNIFVSSWGGAYGNSPYAIATGGTGTLIYRATVHDTSPKLWFYDAGTNYAGSSGSVSSYGYTGSSPVPEPASCALLGLAMGGIGVALKKRKRK